ncbi:MAG: gamma-glutamyltransferase [Phycisphaeraceae bacterium]|nr:gamma-glutamyltransferase [Phycisphaeraceae bacterium]MCB9847428.1 gamma-glutamyltransferase [Phycisphaeraceae bacterium]
MHSNQQYSGRIQGRHHKGWRPFLRAFTLVLAIPAAASAAPRAYTGGVVAADHPLASKAGAEILAQGGNAVDAAVATSFALSVVRPMSCGIGGGGFMIIHLRDNPETPGLDDPIDIALDYRETSPLAIHEDFFDRWPDPEASEFSGAAVAVPTTVEGLLAALERFGTMGYEQVLAPAIRLAQDGYTQDDFEREEVDGLAQWFEENPARKRSHRAAYDRVVAMRPTMPAEIVMNPEQARTLTMLAEQGPELFRTGKIAHAIINTTEPMGGVMTIADLSSDRLRWLEPMRMTFHGRTILTMPPSSSGGIVMAQTLGVIERYEKLHRVSLESMGPNTADSAHLVVEALKHAFADRSRWLGDMPPDDPRITRLLAPEHLQEIASRIQPGSIQKNRTYGWQPPEGEQGADGPLPDDSGTSHISVVDAAGNAVSMTETINLAYGSRILLDEYGFFLNNEMDDFSARQGAANAFGLYQSDANRPGPGKKPLSSMTPTIVLDEHGDVELVLGASGGPRIITGTLQVLLNAIVWGMDAERAVSEPRYHHQWRPNVIAFEEDLDARNIDPGERSPSGLQSLMGKVASLQALRLGLEKKGHNVGGIKTVGAVQLVRRAPDGNGYQAACDPRKGGEPAGLE